VTFGISISPLRAAHTCRDSRAIVIVTPDKRLSHGAT
jgi:hypothetical protein